MVWLLVWSKQSSDWSRMIARGRNIWILYPSVREWGTVISHLLYVGGIYTVDNSPTPEIGGLPHICLHRHFTLILPGSHGHFIAISTWKLSFHRKCLFAYSWFQEASMATRQDTITTILWIPAKCQLSASCAPRCYWVKVPAMWNLRYRHAVKSCISERFILGVSTRLLKFSRCSGLLWTYWKSC